MIYALILAGGKGVRLYPLSRKSKPKQFLNVFGNKSFLRDTLDRVLPIINKDNVYVVTNEDYKEKIYEETDEINKENIFVEPENKETATCIGLSCAKLLKKDKDATLVVLPSDHYIEGKREFKDTILQGIEIAEKKRGLVTIGVLPTRPETGYGYIKMGSRTNAAIESYKVERFLEKPNIDVAKDLIETKNYLWNSGIYIFRADIYLREMEKYLPHMYKNIINIYQTIGTDEEKQTIEEQYRLIDGISVDFGIMQKTRKGYVVKCNFLWDDIGTFGAISRYINKKRDSFGKSYMEDSENCFVYSKDKLIIGFGIKDLIIVESKDVILIMEKNKDQELKHLVNKLIEDKSFDEYL
ncbi:MAG: mannose-1-phosphate guanylyltransferase [Clostridiaceae bacterium]